MGALLHNEITALKRKLLRLSALVEESVTISIRCVSEKNETRAMNVIKKDAIVDALEVEVEEDCLKILALHQPVASDLRFIIAALKINNDLERISDLAANIARRAKDLSAFPHVEVPMDYTPIANKTRDMLSQALEAMIQLDAERARRVLLADDEVDQLNFEIFTAAMAKIKKDPENAEVYVQYFSVSKALERIADYATNIAEDIVYMIEGNIVRHTDQQSPR